MCVSPSGSVASAATTCVPATVATGSHAGEVALEVPGADRVAERGQDHHQAADERLGAAAGVHAEQQRHADDPDRDAREAPPARPLSPVSANASRNVKIGAWRRGCR